MLQKADIDQDEEWNESLLIKAIEEAIEKSGEMIERKLAHCMFIGPPGSGKSSLIYRLLGKLKETFSKSTGVSDSVIVVDIREINPSSLHSVTILNSEKWEEIDYEVSVLRQLAEEKSAISFEPEKVHEVKVQKIEATKREEATEERILQSVEEPPLHDAIENVQQVRFDFISGAQPPKYVAEKTITIAIPKQDVLSIVRKYGLQAFKDYLRKTCSLYLRDTGGQVEFQEMLPLLVSGPSIFFFVFRVDKDITKKFDVEYRMGPNMSINSYTSSITTEEALLQCLASVHAIGTPSGDKTHKPLVLIIGTHQDKLGPHADERVKKLNSDIESLVEKNGFQDLVLYANASTNQVIFMVDNKSEDDKAFQPIRSKVTHLVNGRKEFLLRYPIKFLLVCLDLQSVKENIISLSDFKILAGNHDVWGDEVFLLLKFLHYRVGIIRYYDVDGLRDVIVIQPQVLFNAITDLVIKTFSCEALTSSEIRQFKEKGVIASSSFESVVMSQGDAEASKGILSASAIRGAAKGSDRVSPEQFLQLCVHLRIIAPLSLTGEQDQKYFIPCVLNHVAEAGADSVRSCIEPLAVKFHCQHCPKGLFGVLVTHLMNPKSIQRDINFTLMQNKIFKDQVSFKVSSPGYCDVISLKAFSTHLEINFFPDSADDRDSPVAKTCERVRSILEESINRSLNDLHYNKEKVDPIIML